MHLPEDSVHELLRIAARYGTPTYVTDIRRIDRRVQALRQHLAGSISKLLYALKANALPEIVEFVRDRGIGVDVVSPGELILAEQLGIQPDNIFFSANNMTADELEFAISRGVVVNIGEISRLEAFARSYPRSPVCIRLNTQYGAGHHRHVITAGQDSKFGLPLDDLDRVQALVEAGELHVTGVHQHIGSGNLDIEPYRLSLEILLGVAEKFRDLEYVNIGGGLGIPYGPGESEIDLAGLSSVVSTAKERFRRSTGREVALWMEPGRYLVADAGVLLAQVNTVKTSYGHTYLGTNSGMNHLLRPALYGAYHEVVNLSNPSGATRKYDVVGNICESSDFFARSRDMPETHEGDILAILGTGAYGSSMLTEYNLRPAPAEVLIDLDGRERLARKRETPAELVERLLSGRV